MAHKVIDRRGTDQKTSEICRCCGSPEVHTRSYHSPTQQCVEYLRKQIADMEARLKDITKLR